MCQDSNPQRYQPVTCGEYILRRFAASTLTWPKREQGRRHLPAYHMAANAMEVESFANDIGLPAVVKGSGSTGAGFGKYIQTYSQSVERKSHGAFFAADTSRRINTR